MRGKCFRNSEIDRYNNAGPPTECELITMSGRYCIQRKPIIEFFNCITLIQNSVFIVHTHDKNKPNDYN